MPHSYLSHFTKIVFVIILFFISPNDIFGFQGDNVDTIYNVKNEQTFTKLSPTRFELQEGIDKIFSVPVQSSVGTNSLDNSIIFLNFKKPKVQYEAFLKDPFAYVGEGDFDFLPLFSDKMFGYAQKRVFYIFDIAGKRFVEHWICKDLAEYITQATIVDPEKRIFAFGITKFIEDPVKPTVEEKLIRTYDLSGETPKLLATFNRKDGGRWTASNKMIFIFNKMGICALDEYFNNISHPLVNFLMERKKGEEIRIENLKLHPTLPFAIVKETGEKVSAVSWGNDQPGYFPLLNGSVIDRFSFSPDGQWFLFFESFPKPIKLIAIPVTSKKPYYLGQPVLLAKSRVVPYETRMAWVSDPLSYVILGTDTLLVWDLSKWKTGDVLSK